MDAKILNFASYVCFFALILQFPCSKALISTTDVNQPHPKAIADLKEAIVKGLGFQSNDFTISGFDSRDALVGQSMAYEFDVEIDRKVHPFKLLEDVHRWEYVDLPIFQTQDQSTNTADEKSLVDKTNSGETVPVLAPFQLAGPMELWIQDAKDMRVSLPHDVDAGELRKVILADGAVVTVKGARSVSLRHPIELPLPLNNTKNGFASGLLTLAERLRQASQTQTQLLSLRIVGPTSLTSPTTASSRASKNKLKLKRLAPGLVELSSVSKTAISTIDLHGEAPTLLTPDHFTTLWPVTSLNGSHSNLLGLEQLLSSVLGSKAHNEGSFKLLKADISAHTFVKIGFRVDRKLTGNVSDWVGQLPEWRTKPETMRMHFEVLAKVDGDKFVPESVMQVNPVAVEHTTAPSVITGNVSASKIPIVQTPISPFAL